MRKRHSPALPRLWLMTDERMGDRLWEAIARLPRGSGIIFRHYRLDRDERSRLFRKVRRLAKRNRHVLLVGGCARDARRLQADGHHQRSPRGTSRIHSAPAHNLPQLIEAHRLGADLVFVSPVHPTRSHPRARPLGISGFGRLARASRVPVIALGGMTATRFRRLALFRPHGWAAIDGLTAP